MDEGGEDMAAGVWAGYDAISGPAVMHAVVPMHVYACPRNPTWIQSPHAMLLTRWRALASLAYVLKPCMCACMRCMLYRPSGHVHAYTDTHMPPRFLHACATFAPSTS